MRTRRNCLFSNLFFKLYRFSKQRLILLVLLFIFFQSFSQPCANTLSGTYTVGINGNFTTLSSASVAYNSSCLSGPVVFLLTDSLYSNAEVFPIVFERNPDASISNTLTIKPQSGMNVNILSNTDNTPVIRIKGSHIMFDGSNNGTETRNLSLTNNSIVSPRVFYLQSKSTAPTVNIMLKNMILTNGNDRSVISLGDTIDAAGIMPGYFTDVTIKNNQIRRSLYGIFATAKVQSGNGNGLWIEKNDLTDSASVAIRFTGIYLKGVDGGMILNNIIGNFDGTDSATDKGIWIADTVRNTIVSGNKIYNLNYTGNKGNGSHGIYLSTGFTNASITIANNMIANLSGDGADYSSGSKLIDNPTGIMIDNFPSNQSGIKLFHNSIFLGGVTGFTNTLNSFKAMSSCVRLKGGSVAELRNNILVNKLGRRDSLGFGSVCIMTSTGNAQIGGLDNNLYWVSPSGSGLKFLAYHYNAGNPFPTLASWRSYTGKDQSSISAFPSFIAGNDLHLERAANGNINNKGAFLTGWENDFDGTQRNKINPDMGCDEFMPSNQSNWIGKISNEWFLDSNWEAGVIANDTTDLTIGSNCNFYPEIVDTCSVRNLVLNSGVSTLSMVMDSSSVLHLTGSVSSISGKIGATKGELYLNGFAPQYLGSNVFVNDAILKMTIGNSSDSGVVLQGRLNLGRSLQFSPAGKILQTNDYLTLASNEIETAYIGDLTGKSIKGKVSIERYIPTGLRHGKSWQLISIPVFGNQTINQAWQDSATSPNQNRYPGYGTMLTGMQTNATAFGFDAATPSGGASLRTYRNSDSAFQSVLNTFTPISDSKAYLVLVRGDRSVTTYNASAVPTTLRVKGELYNQLGGIPAPVEPIPARAFELLGNPLPSAIEFRALEVTGDVDSVFYVWDPMLPGAFDLGNYQTLSAINGYLPIPGGTTNYSGLNPVTTIESGQAFFVKGGMSGGSVGFPERAKVATSAATFRLPIRVTHDIGIKIDLSYKNDSVSKLIDGVSLLLDDRLSETDETYKVRKIMPSSRGISIATAGEKLAILNSGIPSMENKFPLILTSMADGHYAIRIALEKNVDDSFGCYLDDKFTGVKHKISEGNANEWEFNWGGEERSRMSDRFEIVVSKPVVVLPVKKIKLEAVRRNSRSNLISWKLEGLEGIRKIMLEKSSNGLNFDSLYLIRNSNDSYVSGNFQDCSMPGGNTFYRLNVLDVEGRAEYSEIKMVSGSNSEMSVMVFSNRELGKKLKIKILHAKPGTGEMNITDVSGKKVFQRKCVINGINDEFIIDIPEKLSSSAYFLNIFTSGEALTKQILF